MSKDLLLLIAVLACPISMCTMMYFMMRGQKKDGTADKDSNKPR